jgi:predicted transposase YdaD
MEYMERRAQLEKEEFEDIVEQNLEEEMATRKVFKTSYEIAEEKAAAKGKIEGKLEGLNRGLRKGVWALLRATTYTDAQIAAELETDEAFVKTVRQEFLASQQQG